MNDRRAEIAARFDAVAAGFDAALQRYQYFGHEKLYALWQSAALSARDLRVLELGCGTGIAGKLFASSGRFASLVGVDLSSRMLEQAQRLGIYQRLVAQDALAFLHADSARYDVVLATDFLQYIADPPPLIECVARRLAPGGVFAFTIDSHDGAAPVQRSSFNDLGWTQSPAAVKRWLEEAGFTITGWEPMVDRMSWSTPPQPVPGYAVVACR